jgi:hypothetical protein
MDDGEDSATRPDEEETRRTVPGEELTRWFEQELTTLPPPMSRLAALRLLLTDLEKVERLFRLNGHAGYAAAAKAIVRACFALGRQNLSTPFRILTSDLEAVRVGMPTYALRVSRKVPGHHKSRIEWDIAVEACGCLEILMKDLKVKSIEAQK